MTSFAEAVALFRRGDARGARKAGEKLLRQAPKDPQLLEFVGIMRCQTGDGVKGVAALRAAAAARPANPGVRQNLAQALVDLGRLAEAESACAEAAALPDPGERRARLHAWLLQALGRPAEAARLYEALVARHPEDAESWNNLGNARRALRDLAAAAAALVQAARLRPADAAIHCNLSRALLEAGDEEGALAALRAYRGPPDAGLETERANLLAGAARVEEAERAYRAALAVEPASADAWFGLGLLLEHGGRGDEVAGMLAEADAAGVHDDSLHLLRAFALRREGRIEEALAAAEAAPADVEPARRLQLIGEMSDRLGRADAAWQAFAAMNETAADAEAEAGAAIYRDEVEQVIATVTPAWAASWTPPAPPPERPAPIFLVGFPRSGTTLLDTMLMANPRLLVLEERPLWNRVIEEAGGLERLATLSQPEIERLRAFYFAGVDEHAPDAGGRIPVDKMPLNLARLPWLHRLFPEAKIILSLRHPADVVLSCLFTNFKLNYAMANFLDLGDAARLYDRVMSAWEASRTALGLTPHAIRYEDLIADPDAALRPLFAYVGLDWTPEAADHRQAARARGYVASASYAQVTEPIYRRAEGRWTRYRDRLAPILPILAPWAERFGYALEGLDS
ncbi:MAG TPA: sulfotransferase [Allosphingosinicella sp.]